MKAKREVPKLKFVPGVVVVTEKHGTAYFHAPDEAALHKAALMTLKGRLKDGFWYDKPEQAPKAPDYTDPAEIEKLKGAIKDTALRLLNHYRKEVAQYKDDIFQFERIQKAVAEKDGATAWKILREHADYEYQRVDFEPYSTSYTGMT